MAVLLLKQLFYCTFLLFVMSFCVFQKLGKLFLMSFLERKCTYCENVVAGRVYISQFSRVDNQQTKMFVFYSEN